MTDKSNSRRVRIVAKKNVDVRIARGLISFKPGWEGRVKSEVFEELTRKGNAIEIFRDGEPPSDLDPKIEPVTFEDFEDPATIPENKPEDFSEFIDEQLSTEDFEGAEDDSRTT